LPQSRPCPEVQKSTKRSTSQMLSSSPLLHTQIVHFPWPYCLHSLKLYLISSLPLSEGQTGVAQGHS
jgi:hypothetical protein